MGRLKQDTVGIIEAHRKAISVLDIPQLLEMCSCKLAYRRDSRQRAIAPAAVLAARDALSTTFWSYAVRWQDVGSWHL